MLKHFVCYDKSKRRTSGVEFVRYGVALMTLDNLSAEPARVGMTIPLGPGSHLTLKAVGEDTEQAFALMEYVLAPGGGAGLHTHSREDESFYVLAGELAVQLRRVWCFIADLPLLFTLAE